MNFVPIIVLSCHQYEDSNAERIQNAVSSGLALERVVVRAANQRFLVHKTSEDEANARNQQFKDSSTWAADQFEPQFGSHDGFAAFSVSASQKERIPGYIGNQEELHRRRLFREELEELV